MGWWRSWLARRSHSCERSWGRDFEPLSPQNSVETMMKSSVTFIMGRHILSSFQRWYEHLWASIFFFLSFFSGLAVNFGPLIYFKYSKRVAHCQSTAVAGSQLPLPATMPPPPPSLRVHLPFRSETLIALLRRRPSCDAPHCRTTGGRLDGAATCTWTWLVGFVTGW
jgi:hypothetical protein